MFTSCLKWIFQTLRVLGPYLVVELLLPGGTLLAVALWLSRHGEIGRWHAAAQTAKDHQPPKALVHATLR